MSALRSQSSLVLFACLLCTALAADAVRAQAIGSNNHPLPPPVPKCWSISGPITVKGYTHFDAANHCDTPRHCRAWVNGHEPPSQIHLDSGASGRIDVGPTEAVDKYSLDCVEVAPGM